MNRRSKVITAVALFVIGAAVSVSGWYGGASLSAASIGETAFNLAKIMVWVGAAIMIASAVLFISASSD